MRSEETEVKSVLENMSIKDDTFSMDELKKAKKYSRDGKQAGPDNIPPEVLKSCNFDEILSDFANNLLEKMEKPRLWSEINLIPVPKSGDLSDTGSYRGSSLAPIIAKLVDRMVLNRI